MATVVCGGSVVQRREALLRANAVRFAMRDVKCEVAAGVLSVADALVDERAQALGVGVLLMCQPRWGVCKTRRFLFRLFAREGGSLIGEHRRVRDLTERQLGLIVDALGEFR